MGVIMSAFSNNAKGVFVVTNQNWHITKCITLLEMAALAFSVSLSNFSLAYITTIVMVPIALVSRPNYLKSKDDSMKKDETNDTIDYSALEKQSMIGRLIRLGTTILCHPLCLLTIASSLDTIKEFGLW